MEMITTKKTNDKKEPIRMAAYSFVMVLKGELKDHYMQRAEYEKRDVKDLVLQDVEEYHEHMRFLEREGSRLK